MACADCLRGLVRIEEQLFKSGCVASANDSVAGNDAISLKRYSRQAPASAPPVDD